VTGLVPGPALCSGAGAAERPQEILYCDMTGEKRVLQKKCYYFIIRKVSFYSSIFSWLGKKILGKNATLKDWKKLEIKN
jgi:hypothetical protein